MSRRNTNRGGNPIFADNSDRTFNTLLAELPSESPQHSKKSGKEGQNQPITAKQILVKILQETTQTGVNLLQKLTGQGHH